MGWHWSTSPPFRATASAFHVKRGRSAPWPPGGRSHARGPYSSLLSREVTPRSPRLWLQTVPGAEVPGRFTHVLPRDVATPSSTRHEAGPLSRAVASTFHVERCELPRRVDRYAVTIRARVSNARAAPRSHHLDPPIRPEPRKRGFTWNAVLYRHRPASCQRNPRSRLRPLAASALTPFTCTGWLEAAVSRATSPREFLALASRPGRCWAMRPASSAHTEARPVSRGTVDWPTSTFALPLLCDAPG